MTLATRLLLLIALALTPPLLLGILNDVVQRSQRAAALDRTAIAETRSLQDSLLLITDGVHRLLIALAEAPPIRSGDAAGCTRYLKAVGGELKEYPLLAVLDRTGTVICNSEGSAPGSYSVKDRAYLQRALESGRFSSGDLVIGTVTRRRSLHFAMPFKGMDGALAGIVVANIDQAWLATQLATESVPVGSEVLMIDPGGVIVAAAQNGVPVQEDWVGLPASPALLERLTVSAPSVVEAHGPDGKLRMFGALPPNPALLGNRIAVGLDRKQAFSDLRAASVGNLLGLGIGGIIALLAAIFTARRFVLGPLGRIAAAADRVGAGDLKARADLGRHSGELRELGAGFDRMIAALAAREQERDQAEAALRREEARLRLALEAGGLGTFEWDLSADTVEFSETVRTMFGFGPGEGHRSTDYCGRIIAEDRDQAFAEVKAGITAGRVVHSFRITRGAERRFILVQAETVRDAARKPFLIGLLADETERFENIAALREGEARFQAIADCIDQMVWSTRPDGYHDYFNQRWYDYTGTPPGSSDGASWLNLFHPDDHEETQRVWKLSLATGRPYHREYRLLHVSGRYRWVLGRAQAIRDDEGRITRWYGTCTDIDEIVEARDVLARSREALTREIADRTAELMAAEEQLRQSQKMEAVGQLTGGIAHDFNNMLQAIGGALELLVRRVEQNRLDDAKRFAGIARTTVDRAAALTHRLLAFARRQTLSPESVDPAALVEGMSELVARTVGPGIDFSVRHGSDQWTVLCDLSQLENVVFNLCINARDAMPSGGKLTITTQNVTLAGSDIVRTEGAGAGDYVEIAVLDTGAGMDEATRARAFEPFFTTKPLGQGTGLGLSQVYGFVRQSGGFVRLESELDEGTTVRLFLPRHGPTEGVAADRLPERSVDQPPADPPEASRPNEGAVILLVEADEAARTATAQHLGTLGYRVRESADGATAMHLLDTGNARPDMLVTDVGLPGNLNGRQIAEMARHRRPGLPILFMTFYAGSLGANDLDAGMAVIARPVTHEALAARIRAMLTERTTARLEG